MKDYPPYFTREELECKCGRCNGNMDDAFMRNLIKLRKHLGWEFVVTSAYRCPAYNARVSSTGRTGPHTHGRAIDIKCHGIKAFELVSEARAFGMTGIGVRQSGSFDARFVHLDTMTNSGRSPRPWVWTY